MNQQELPQLMKFWATEVGYKAVILKHPSLGHLCGYVAVPKTHPLNGVAYNQPCGMANHEEWCDVGMHFSVHGGVTYTGDLPPTETDAWWWGFDCAHAGDLVPGIAERYGIGIEETYRDETYVTAECERLAFQLWEYAL